MSAKSKLSSEQIINRAIGLIDLLESKLLAEYGDKMFPSQPDFRPDLSAGLCGITHLATDIKRELVNLIPEL